MFEPAVGVAEAPRAQPEDDPARVTDPLADLLLSVAAVILLAVIAILPTIGRNPASHGVAPGHSPDLSANTGLRLRGHSVTPWVATELGLVTGAPSTGPIPVDRILSDDGLAATLQRMRDADEAVVLLIEPKGFEAAFQFEVVSSLHGPKRMRQVRLETQCGDAPPDRIALVCAELNRQAPEMRR